MKEFTIGQNDAGQRLDKFLGKAVPLLPSSMMYKGIRTKRIKVNSKRAEISTRLAVGDVVSLYLNDEFFEEKRADETFLRAGDALSVIYEDENILIADKPAGLVVHEDESGTADTLIGRVQKYLYQKGEYDPAQENSFAPALCNRIDRNTCGLVIAAKNAAALREMNEIIRERDVKKLYLAAAKGRFAEKSGRLVSYLEKFADENRVVVKDKKNGAGDKKAVSLYTVLGYNEKLDVSLLEIELVTGRTHQIRVHLAWRSHPILGDTVYGHKKPELGVDTQCLHARELTFVHPRTGARVTVSCELPEYFQELLRKLRQKG